jgi:hypothetical protein
MRDAEEGERELENIAAHASGEEWGGTLRA